MKKILLFALVFAFAGVSYAQEKNANAASIKTEKKNNFDEWSSFLNLNDAQKQQIQGIQTKYQNEKAGLRKSGSVADFKNLSEKQQAEINAVLTPEQIKKAEEYNALKEKEKAEKAAIKTAVR